MFHKKYATKDSKAVGKKDIKKLKEDFLTLFGDNKEDICEALFEKRSVSSRRCQLKSGSSASLYLINNVPFFIKIDRFSTQEKELCFGASPCRSTLIPTVFCFLRLRSLAKDENRDQLLQWSSVGAFASTYEATSSFLIGGANLMKPGIVSLRGTPSVKGGDLVLVSSIGVDFPYAIGLASQEMESQENCGVGVFVVHCYGDELWKEFSEAFVSQYSLDSRVALIPPEFQDEIVRQCSKETPRTSLIDDVSAEVIDNSGNDDAFGDSREKSVESFASLFPDEDSILFFCLCEAVKLVEKSKLPLQLNELTSILVSCYPRGGICTGPIHFKDTKYKKALPFLLSADKIIKVEESTHGVHCVVNIFSKSPAMRAHNEKYSIFLETVQQEAIKNDARAFELQKMEDSRAALHQKILSVQTFYVPRRDMDEEIARVLLLGDNLCVSNDVKYPTIEQVVSGTAPVRNEAPLDANVWHERYVAAVLKKNLKSYVNQHNLYIFNEESKVPDVQLDVVLSKMFSVKSLRAQLPLFELFSAMMNLFSVYHEIIIQTVVEGMTLVTNTILPRCIVKRGEPRKIYIWTEARAGNKVVTILKNLDALGFNLELLARAWSKQFCTHATVVDPSTQIKKLKPGKTIPLEIHIQGDFTRELNASLAKEMSIPGDLLVNGRH